MKKIIIADIIGKYDATNKLPFGHYLKFFLQYHEILKNSFDVTIACSKKYKDYLPKKIKSLTLKYDLEYNLSRGRICTIKSLFGQMFNLVTVLSYSTDVLIIQSVDSLIPLLPLLFYFGQKKIILVIYKDNLLENRNKFIRVLKRFLFKLYKRSIFGIITGIKEIGIKYQTRYITVPDYITSQKKNVKNNNFVYDIAVLGINSRSKDLEDLISSFQNTHYKILIAGRFVEKRYLEELENMKSDNIVIIDDYLDEDTYNKLLTSSKYIAFPYKPNIYRLQSSGVFYEAIYNLKPVICSNTSFFSIVAEKDLGFVYKNSISESKEILDNESLYEKYKTNVKIYERELSAKSRKRLVKFLKNI